MIESGLTNRLQALRDEAIAAGWLPADATVPGDESRPWPVVLLTALGAWLAALPLLGVAGLLLADLVVRSAGAYLVGLAVLGGAGAVLRSRSAPLFVEQLAVPALLAGGGTLAFALFRDLPDQAAAGALLALVLGLAWGIPRPWLRNLIGATAAALTLTMLLPTRLGARVPVIPFWLVLHVALAIWVVAMVMQERVFARAEHARVAQTVESTATGWLLLVFAGLAFWSGMSFLVAGAMGSGFASDLGRAALGAGRDRPLAAIWVMQAGSVLAALAGAAVMARAWPTLRRPLAAGAMLVALALAWFLPALGAAVLALAICAATHRWRLAAAGALAVAWIVGSFYYRLQWTLADKALILAACGTVLAALAWWAQRSSVRAAPAIAGATEPRRTAWIALAAVAAVSVASFSIWQKEELIARGDKVFVQLAPVDPRSLMQGDYMRLNYNVPGAGRPEPGHWVGAERPYVLARRDDRGIAHLIRVASQHEPRAPGEMLIELTPKNGRWILVSDAWFFAEGDGARWERARYGEFRVAADGRALLVGLADEKLQPIPLEP